jgi:nicotinamide-nucleotide amidase
MDAEGLMAALVEHLGQTIETLTKRLLKTAKDRELSLAAAESCSGGLLASVLTDVEGCSSAFDRGFVAYTDRAKHELLGVPLDQLRTCGAVSEPVCRAMAEGALRRSEADLAAAITGFAGPAGPGDPPGLVFVGVARRGRATHVRRLDLGDIGREPVRLCAVEAALEMMLAAT